MPQNYTIITLADGVTKAIQLPGPVVGLADLQSQLADLQQQLQNAQSDRASAQANEATAQQTIDATNASIATITDQITAIQNPAIQATPTTITTTNPAQAL
jgi:peptidoglycan hydrolase CwlO-like protein